MRSNPCVYPTIDFPIFSTELKVNKSFNRKDASFREIEKEIKKIKYKNPKIIGKDIERRILSIFLDATFLFGPNEYIYKSRKEFFDTILFFVKQNKPISLSLLGFPFKAEVPIKTNRILPDMGEVLVLHKLFFLTQCIKKEYAPGSIITLFTEERFAEFANVNRKNAELYIKGIKVIVKKLGYSKSIRIESLSSVEKFPEFKKVFSKNKATTAHEVKVESGIGYEQYLKSFPSVFRLISVNKISDDILLSIYRTKNPDLLSQNIRSFYRKIEKQTKAATIKYLAYIKTKNDLDFVNKRIGRCLSLTVSPKIGRIGILPIDKNINKLPYHGVSVKNSLTGEWNIRYLCEIKYDNKKYIAVHLKGDYDKQPFFYLLML